MWYGFGVSPILFSILVSYLPVCIEADVYGLGWNSAIPPTSGCCYYVPGNNSWLSETNHGVEDHNGSFSLPQDWDMFIDVPDWVVGCLTGAVGAA